MDVLPTEQSREPRTRGRHVWTRPRRTTVATGQIRGEGRLLVTGAGTKKKKKKKVIHLERDGFGSLPHTVYPKVVYGFKVAHKLRDCF